MSSDFQNFIASGFTEAAETFSPTDLPEVITFNGKTAKVVSGALAGTIEMKNAGMKPEFDRTAVVLETEFNALGAGIEDAISIGSGQLEIKSITRATPLVMLGLKEIP